VPYTFPLAEVREFLTALNDGGVRASIDPAKVNPPGVWLRLLPLEHDTLGAGSTLRAEAVCVVQDVPDDAALDLLADLHDRVVALVDVDGPCRWQGTILPGPDLSALPSLVVPVLIHN
jgi:hypothetical protein